MMEWTTQAMILIVTVAVAYCVVLTWKLIIRGVVWLFTRGSEVGPK